MYYRYNSISFYRFARKYAVMQAIQRLIAASLFTLIAQWDLRCTWPDIFCKEYRLRHLHSLCIQTGRVPDGRSGTETYRQKYRQLLPCASVSGSKVDSGAKNR